MKSGINLLNYKFGLIITIFLISILTINASEYTSDANTVALYHFNEGSGNVTGSGSTVIDSSGNSYDGTAFNSTFWDNTNKLYGNGAICFIGNLNDINSRVVLPPLAFNNLPEGTLEFWMYPFNPAHGDPNGAPYIFAKYKDDGSRHFDINYVPNYTGFIEQTIYYANSMDFVTSSANSVPLTKWTHIAFTWDSTSSKIYINGILNVAGSTNSIANYPNGAIELGQILGGYNFKGCLDELRISNIARTTFETNRAPNLISNIPNQDFDEDNSTIINLSAYFIDPDGNPLTYSVSGNSNIVIQINSGVATLTPNQDWNGQETITFRATDTDNNFVDSNPVTITINSVNDAPVLNLIGNKSVDENQLLTFTIFATDPESNPLTYSANNLPLGSSFDVGTQSFSWTPDYNQAGTYNNIQFNVNDGTATTSETISITVNNVNRAPIINTFSPSSTQSVDENSSLTFTVDAVDEDGDALTYTWYLDGNEVSTGQTYIYTPDFDSAGTYTLEIEVSDSISTTLQGWDVTVNNVNRAPILTLSQNSLQVNENEIADISSLITTIDPDGDSVSLSYSEKLNSIGQWQTTYDDAGNYAITITASDGSLEDSKTFNLEVLNVNRAPVINTFSPTSNPNVNEGSSLTLNLDVSDPDGDTLNYKWYLNNIQVATTQNYTYSPDYNSAGNHNITLIISDSNLETSNIWNVTVNDAAPPSSGGGGGGGGGSSSSDSDVALGEGIVNKQLSKGDVLYVKTKEGDKLKIEINGIKDGVVKLYLTGYGDIELKIGEKKEIDTDGDGIFDAILYFEDGKFDNVNLNIETVKESKETSEIKESKQENKESKQTIKEITPEKPTDVSVSGSSVKTIRIEVNNPAKNVEITVRKVEGKPAEVTKVDNVYEYLEINKGNLKDEDIKGAEVEFEVTKSYINEQGTEEVILLRYHNNQWNKLETEKVREEGDNVKFKAKTPGFSYFAITTESSANTITGAVVGSGSNYGLISILIVLGLTGIGVAGYVRYKKKFKKLKK